MKLLLLALALACAACGTDQPDSAGVAPEIPVTPAIEAQPRVELATPPADLPPSPEIDPAVAPPTKIVFEIAPYGRFEVITWDEAARQADARISAPIAQAELRRIRQDLLARSR